VFAAILKAGVQKGGPMEPVAQKTSLGWILSGGVASSLNQSSGTANAHQCLTTENLSDLVKKFWEQEEMPPTQLPLTEEEQQCEEFYVTTHTRNAEGRYVVRLPLTREEIDLTPTRAAALRLLSGMERRFVKDEKLRTMYKDFMHQYVELEHMSIVDQHEDTDPRRICYLPHHGVLRESSATTKLRVVFNGSLSIASGESLNKYLLIGRNLLPGLVDVLLQWRAHRYVIAADVEKMYRQILIHPEDRDLQRILWRFERSDDIREYRLNTVTYGLACAPYLAIRTLRQLADDEEDNYPLGAAVLRKNVYVDDVLTGHDTLEKAQETQRQLISLCKAGGFPLKKWAANHADLLSKIPPEDRLPLGPLEWQPQDCCTMLGLRWHPSSDEFSFAVKTRIAQPITKRFILSRTAQLYDPLGWLAPVVIRAKILIQTTWIKGLDWDTPLEQEDCQAWQMLQGELQALEKIRISRWLSGNLSGRAVELHGFADASERAYAVVVYLRIEDHGASNISLLAAKSKVAPLKQVSLPRLELCAATLLAQLITYVQNLSVFQISTVHLWLDSTVALSWVQSHPSRWKTYVANRVAEIQRLLKDPHWHHVRSSDNPADCASRGVSPRDLVDHNLWWNGPPWLAKPRDKWPTTSVPAPSDGGSEQRRAITAVATKENAESRLLQQYSSLIKLLRVTAWCKRWLRYRQPRCRNQVQPSESGENLTLSVEEIDEAEKTWVKTVQAASYKNELATLLKGKFVAKGSSLSSLNPFIDEHGVLRVGGRIKHSLLPAESKHLVILPAQSQFTALMIHSCHRRTMHGGAQQTLGLLRQRFWVPQGRRAVKHQIHLCVRCVRWRAASPHQVMADLPQKRVTPSRPFQHSGVDYAGPVMLRTASGRGHKAHKAFLVVFVCMSTKAVHLDVASDYSANAFLAAFRRFVACRGLCQTLHSDCGTNFVGADSQLRSLFSEKGKEARTIAEQLASDKVQWIFNPPSAPHFGGLWEAAVKSMKHHIRRTIGDSTLTYEEMATLLAQVEACLNSRPLQALTDDPSDMEALTPGHFLIGTALNAVPENSVLDANANTLSRWQHIQRMRDSFWDRWSRDYLQGLITRPKWRSSESKLELGRLCLVRNENFPPNKWPLARIIKLHPGSDERTRVVTVKTANSELVRPITKLVLLPSAASD